MRSIETSELPKDLLIHEYSKQAFSRDVSLVS